MSTRRDLESIETMLRAAHRIKTKTDNVTFDEFRHDEDLLDICAIQAQIMGNSADSVSVTLQQRYPEVDWHGLYGLRCAIAHSYGGKKFNTSKLWNDIKSDLPKLIDDLEMIYDELQSDTSKVRSIRGTKKRRFFKHG